MTKFDSKLTHFGWLRGGMCAAAWPCALESWAECHSGSSLVIPFEAAGVVYDMLCDLSTYMCRPVTPFVFMLIWATV